MVSFVKSSYTISGQLTHPDGDPLPNQKVCIFSPGWLQDKLKAEVTTDWEGYFTLNFKKKDRQGNLDLILKVFEETRGGKKGDTCIKMVPLSLDPKKKEYNLDPTTVHLDERQQDLPMLERPEKEEQNPEPASFAYRIRLLQATLLPQIKAKLTENISIEAVQKLFPGFPQDLTEENVLDMLLNGIDPCHFRLDGEGNLCHLIQLHQYSHDQSPVLPTIGITLKKKEDSKNLRLKGIYVAFPNEEEIESLPRRVSCFLLASMALIEGELKFHLGLGHMMTGQLALSFFRTINNNPIRKLLEAHLSGVAIINQLGAGFIFGKPGVLNTSGLTPEGINEGLRAILAAQDFANFKPREPLSPQHRFAFAQKLYWEIVTKVVEQFFQENKASIEENWQEIYLLSRSLIRNSLPFEPLNDDGAPPEFPWSDTNEIAGLKTPLPRHVYQDRLRAISPITLKKENPDADDLERLKQFCRYALFLSTFYHFALHGSQTSATDLTFASLAPEGHGEEPYGGTKPENGATQLSIANTLLDFKGPSLLDNPDNDIYPPFIEAIKEKLPEFLKLGYDLSKMNKGVII